MDEQRLIDRCRSKGNRILIGLRIQLRRVCRRPVVLLTNTGRSAVGIAVRFSRIGWLAGWVRRHPRWAALELAGLLLAAVFGFPAASPQTGADAVDIEETAIRFDDIKIHEDSSGGFAEHALYSPSSAEVMSSRTPSSHILASKLEGSSFSDGPLLVPVPPADPASKEQAARFHPATTLPLAAPRVSRFVRTSGQTVEETGAWLTGTIESAAPAVRTAGRIQFNPPRRQ